MRIIKVLIRGETRRIKTGNDKIVIVCVRQHQRINEMKLWQRIVAVGMGLGGIVLLFGLWTRPQSVLLSMSLDASELWLESVLSISESDLRREGCSWSDEFRAIIDVSYWELIKHAEAQHVCYHFAHRYDIGAKGALTIDFNLVAYEKGETRLSIICRDAWIGMWPPFVYFSPCFREKVALKRLIETKLAQISGLHSKNGE